MLKMFQWVHPLSWSSNLFQGSHQSGSNPKSQLIYHYFWFLYPNSPTRQTGIIVLSIYFVLFQPLGWGHIFSSLVPGIQICPTFSWRLQSRIIYLWVSKGLMIRSKSCCQSCFAPLECCFIWSLQLLLFIMLSMQHWPQELFIAGIPHLGIHNWDRYFSILSTISTVWLR